MSLLSTVTPREQEAQWPKLSTRSAIRIYHPVQHGQGTPIFTFPVFPSSPDHSAVIGLPLGLILDACSVVAMNKRGELQATVAPNARIGGADDDPDCLLAPGEYQFIVAEGGALDYTYHLCEAPDLTHVSDAGVPDAVITEDKSCVVTGAISFLQASPLVPLSTLSSGWCESNYNLLSVYGSEPPERINSVQNQVTLCGDLAQALHDEGFAGDLAFHYHMRVVNFPERIRRGYLFIRFAYNIFKFYAKKDQLAGVAAKLPRRSLKRTHAETASDDERSSKKSKTDKSCQSEEGEDECTILTADEPEAMLAIHEEVDAKLQEQPYLTADDIEAGHYPGYSRFKRLELEYKRANPQVSAVTTEQFWLQADDA
ncbi:hypothetical protein FB45DRAFT_1024015 [Roridomyces roridus]|uniref:HNH nuclease domain-containing protein n=1 Tax=Roridomyces roridus TaxID=1738132 RepID=A0AAD7C597_9AGAR|nr:hypothetical protein FB45DRAFT_1024015 [Roridomyces roridus]